MLPAILRYRTLSLAGPYEQTPRLRWPTSATHLVACSMYFIRLVRSLCAKALHLGHLTRISSAAFSSLPVCIVLQAFCKGVAQQNKALPMTVILDLQTQCSVQAVLCLLYANLIACKHFFCSDDAALPRLLFDLNACTTAACSQQSSQAMSWSGKLTVN